MFFDFAVQYISKHPDVKPDLEVSDEMLEEFRQYLKDKEFDYKTSMQYAYEQLKETVTEENKDSIFGDQLATLSELIENEKSTDFDRSKDFIKRMIKRDIVSAIAGERGVYEHLWLHTDKAVLKAVEIMQQDGEYARMLAAGSHKAELN